METASNGRAVASDTTSSTNRPSCAARPAPNLDAPANDQQPSNGTRVQQPKPQALPARSGPNSILVSSRQKGNTVLNHIRSFPWEYADIAADYVLGATTCALFLSLKYHRLHPEYVYKRIRDIAGKYNLRVLLTVVDIQNHEEPLRELSKTSLINNVTLILCWSAPEAARYLELYKSCEHAPPTVIRAHQATGYSDKLVEFITTPRSINKTDAVSLISSFGSIRTAINAAPEEVALVPGFGAKKVQRWCNAVREPFRVRKAARRGISRMDSTAPSLARGESSMVMSRQASVPEVIDDGEAGAVNLEIAATVAGRLAQGAAHGQFAETEQTLEEPGSGVRAYDDDEEMAVLEAVNGTSVPKAAATSAQPAQPTKRKEADLSEGIVAALAKLREQG